MLLHDLNTKTLHVDQANWLQTNNISGSGATGDFVKITRFNASQSVVDINGYPVEPGGMIDCFIDDLSCDTICAGKGAFPNSSSEYNKIRIFGSPVEIHDFTAIPLSSGHAGAFDIGAPLGTLKCHEVSCNYSVTSWLGQHAGF